MLSSISPLSIDTWSPQSETHPVAPRAQHARHTGHTAHSPADRRRRTTERVYAFCVLATCVLLIATLA